MNTKVCFKCGRNLPLSEFYAHPQMGDGHLNKCKECTKRDVHINYEKKSESEDYMERERKRGREKYKRLNYVLKNKDSDNRRLSNKHISRFLKARGIELNGREAHHWNYNERFSVFLMSAKAHHRIHQKIVVNKIDNYCYTLDGNKIDTVEKAESIFKDILRKKNISEEMVHVEIMKLPLLPKHNSICVSQVNISGDVVATYSSLNEAGLVSGINRKSIANVLDKKITLGGYFWKKTII